MANFAARVAIAYPVVNKGDDGEDFVSGYQLMEVMLDKITTTSNKKARKLAQEEGNRYRNSLWGGNTAQTFDLEDVPKARVIDLARILPDGKPSKKGFPDPKAARIRVQTVTGSGELESNSAKLSGESLPPAKSPSRPKVMDIASSIKERLTKPAAINLLDPFTADVIELASGTTPVKEDEASASDDDHDVNSDVPF